MPRLLPEAVLGAFHGDGRGSASRITKLIILGKLKDTKLLRGVEYRKQK